jgi:predicted phage terminase large subunit-like protein
MSICAKLSRNLSNELYKQVLADNDVEAQRSLCRQDLFYLLTVAFNRRDIDDDWLYARCREVEANPDGYLDLWAREHYKSTIITYAKTIQDILNDPEITVGIFSHTKDIARDFLDQIKVELTDNQYLKDLFPDVLYQNPRRESQSWSRDGGICVKRKTNPKEMTVEGHGLVDGQPTGRHFRLLVYDDVVTEKSVTTEDQIKKATAAWAMSLNLGAHGGVARYIGTRYHFNDTYRTIMERNAAIPRIYTATEDSTPVGKPVFLDAKALAEKRERMGPYIFGSQMLQNPIADSAQGFKEEWLRYVTVVKPDMSWNRYLLCDPAGEKKKENDYTVIVVIGMAPDGNYYLIDGVRDRLNLTERTAKMFEMHRRWKPTKTGYEKYGKDSDIEHIKFVQEQENYRFEIEPLGGPMPKNDRIRRMVPAFEQGRFYFPRRLLFLDAEGNMRDFVAELISDEFTAFPVAIHDDMMDCMSRIHDIGGVFPKVTEATAFPGIKQKPAQANNNYKVI